MTAPDPTARHDAAMAENARRIEARAELEAWLRDKLSEALQAELWQTGSGKRVLERCYETEAGG